MNVSQLEVKLGKSAKLRDALLKVPCFQEEYKRKNVLEGLISEYPGISITSSDIITVAINLIKQCENYEGSFTCLILIMESLYEGQYERQSKPMRYFKQVYFEVFNPSPEQPRLKKNTYGYVIHIIETDKRIDIPLAFPALNKDDIARASKIFYTWKQLHTLCEVLVRDFMPVYKHIMKEQTDLAQTSIKNFKINCADIFTNLNDLDQAIFSFDRMDSLKKIPHCIEPLLETMSYETTTDYFILGQELTEHIIKLLLAVLSLADRIVDFYLFHKSGT
jgi:hypothetical protein